MKLNKRKKEFNLGDVVFAVCYGAIEERTITEITKTETIDDGKMYWYGFDNGDDFSDYYHIYRTKKGAEKKLLDNKQEDFLRDIDRIKIIVDKLGRKGYTGKQVTEALHKN